MNDVKTIFWYLYRFQILKIAVRQCSVHSCSCPWIGKELALKNCLDITCLKLKPSCYLALTKFFDRTAPSKILFPFPWNPYLKTDGTSLPILFWFKNFEEKEIEFLKEWFCQKLLSNDDNNWPLILSSAPKFWTPPWG